MGMDMGIPMHTDGTTEATNVHRASDRTLSFACCGIFKGLQADDESRRMPSLAQPSHHKGLYLRGCPGTAAPSSVSCFASPPFPKGKGWGTRGDYPPSRQPLQRGLEQAFA